MNSLVSLIMSVLKFLLKAFSGNTSKKDTPVPKVEERAEEVVDTRVEPIEIPETPPPETTTKTEEVKVAYTQDKATLDRIQKAHPKVREELGVIYNEICAALTGKAHCRFAYVLRTMDEQAALYAQGRESFRDVNAKRQKAGMYLFKTADENKSKVTNAAAGLSIHNYGLATDIVLLLDKDGNGTYESASWDTKTDFDADHISDWLEIVAIFKKYGWVWGGDWTGFKDLPHFEKTFGHKPSDLLIAYKSGKKDAEGYVIL